MKAWQQHISYLSTALLAVCCGVVLLFGWSGTGWKVLAVPTGSMRPAIPAGSLVFVHRVPTRSLRVGDVITYASPVDPRKTVSHRIIQTRLLNGIVPGFVTKGDANASPDTAVPESSVVGKVQWHAPYIGWWMLMAESPWVILPLVYLIALPIMLEELKRLSDYYKLSQPYRLFGYNQEPKHAGPAMGLPLATGAALVLAALVLGGVFMAPLAMAMLKSNTISLRLNTLTSARLLPTSADQCKNGNWKAFGVFKNEGDCVAFVATHGKNLPANR